MTIDASSVFKALAALLALLVLSAAAFLWLLLAMPGRSAQAGDLAPVDNLPLLAARLRGHVETLAGDIGERHYRRMAALDRAADYIEAELRSYGYEPEIVSFGEQGFRNISVELPGRENARAFLVAGAHYDSREGTPGADDNASGVAVLLELARLMAGREFPLGIRHTAFPNEELPLYGTELMGSRVSAGRAAQRGEEIIGMLSLEMLGYYSDEPGSQRYPDIIRPFFPERGDFVGFVANFASRPFLLRTIEAFRVPALFPSEGMAVPEWLVEDIRRSDNSSYWTYGWPAIMVTDTSNFRNPHYHTATDRPATLDYEAMARVTQGLAAALASLAGG